MFFQWNSLLVMFIAFSFFLPCEINNLEGHGGGGRRGGGGGRRGGGKSAGRRNNHRNRHHDHHDHNHNFNRHRRRRQVNNYYYSGGWGGGYDNDYNDINGYNNGASQAYILDYLSGLNSNSNYPSNAGNRQVRGGGGGESEDSSHSDFHYYETYSDNDFNSKECSENQKIGRDKHKSAKGVFFDH